MRCSNGEKGKFDDDGREKVRDDNGYVDVVAQGWKQLLGDRIADLKDTAKEQMSCTHAYQYPSRAQI